MLGLSTAMGSTEAVKVLGVGIYAVLLIHNLTLIVLPLFNVFPFECSSNVYFPFKYVLILYIDSSAFLRCSACYRPIYFTLKSSTSKVKLIGWVL